jgi:hypothetical protein
MDIRFDYLAPTMTTFDLRKKCRGKHHVIHFVLFAYLDSNLGSALQQSRDEQTRAISFQKKRFCHLRTSNTHLDTVGVSKLMTNTRMCLDRGVPYTRTLLTPVIRIGARLVVTLVALHAELLGTLGSFG